MSASNWTECPKCKAKAEAERLARIESVKQLYGKISPEEFVSRAAKAEHRELLDDDLREDWEIGMNDDGNFSVGYYASCNCCDFTFKFKHEERAL